MPAPADAAGTAQAQVGTSPPPPPDCLPPSSSSTAAAVFPPRQEEAGPPPPPQGQGGDVSSGCGQVAAAATAGAPTSAGTASGASPPSGRDAGAVAPRSYRYDLAPRDDRAAALAAVANLRRRVEVETQNGCTVTLTLHIVRASESLSPGAAAPEAQTPQDAMQQISICQPMVNGHAGDVGFAATGNQGVAAPPLPVQAVQPNGAVAQRLSPPQPVPAGGATMMMGFGAAQ